MKNNILVLGDIHIGRSQNLAKQFAGSNFNSRVIDQFNLLDWVFDKCVEHNVNHLILTGDIFEEPKPHYNLIILFINWLKKCTDYDISVHIIVGNHDMLRSGSLTTSALDIISESNIENVFVYKKITTINLDNIGITFLPFRDRRSFNTDLNSKALHILKNKIPYEATTIDNTSIDRKSVV